MGRTHAVTHSVESRWSFRSGSSADDWPEFRGSRCHCCPRPAVEAHDEWQVSDRHYLSEGSMALLNRTETPTKEVAQPALIES